MGADDGTKRREATKPAEDERKPPEDERRPAENESFVDEELIPVLVVGGVLLFLFPEPATSALGLVLVAIGVLLWITDLIRGS
jgi:hypothetical protein